MQPVWEKKCSPSAAPTEVGALRQRQCAVKKTRHQVALQVFFHQQPPTSIPNDDVILYRPSSHMAQTGCALLSFSLHVETLIPTHRRYHSCRYLRLLRAYLESRR